MATSGYSINTFFEIEQSVGRESSLHSLVLNFQTITKSFTPTRPSSSTTGAENQLTASFKNRQAVNGSDVSAVLGNVFRQGQRTPLSLCLKKPSLRFHA